MKHLVRLVLVAGLVTLGCTIKEAKDDENTKPQDTEIVDRQGPGGVDFDRESNLAGTFPEDNYGDGPELDDTRASLRAIQEADIVQVVANRLYAISEASGLAVIDVSVQDSLTLLGRYRTEAKPFEMYVRGDRVIAMFKEVEVTNEQDNSREKNSRILTLNVANPATIEEQSSVDIEGEITDSRIIDDILYVAAHKRPEYKYYYYDDTDGAEAPTTTIVSLDVSDLTNITEVDRLEFEEVLVDSYEDLGWSKKSITTSDDRLYVSGPISDGNSTIQVVDISDPTGDMVLGTSVAIDGAIFSRWQIDEYNGILRVISQPPNSSYADPPVVQTFTINSSQNISPLASMTMTLPRQELLRSARFDDDKAYAITFEKIDPLFVIDLSDPAAPVQAGEVEIPGFVFHLEPRGDRLLGLGFEPGNMDGGLHVSLFDVSDISNPSQISRVNFGPTWGSVASLWEKDLAALIEDQNRIHKSFKVLDALNLILVPFSGWSNEQLGCGQFNSGVQLVDFTTDSLTKRATIGAVGTARRAFLHDDRMFTFSENQLQVFDITDRDAPVKTASMALSQRVHRTVLVGDKVMRIASEWFNRVAYADFVDLANVEDPELGPNIDLAAMLNEDDESCEYHDDAPFANAPAFVFGSHVAMPVVHRATGEEYYVTDLLVIDTNGAAPTLAATLFLDFEPLNTGLGSGIVQVGDTLVFQRPGDNYDDELGMQDLVLEIVDMTNPATPQLLSNSVTRPYAAGTTGLHVNSDELVSGYFSFDEEDNVSYFLDRTDTTNPMSPSTQDPVSFPGLLLGPLADDYLGVDFDWRFVTDKDRWDCGYDGGYWDELQTVCWFLTRQLQRVAISGTTASATASAELESSLEISAVLLGNERYYLPAQKGSYDKEIVVIGTNGSGLAASTIDLAWWDRMDSPTVKNDVLYFLTGSSLAEVKAVSANDPSLSKMPYPGSAPSQHLMLTNDKAIIACGNSGVVAVDI